MNFKLEELKDMIVTFSTVQCMCFTENCIVALESIPHTSGCELSVTGLHDGKVTLAWSTAVNKNGYKEQIKFTEKGAEALSFFLVTNLTDYQLIEEAVIGTGVDYWLGYNENHENYDTLNFLIARLEVSGILKENGINTLEKRVKIKQKQINTTTDAGIPTYISVVEFSKLKAHIVKK